MRGCCKAAEFKAILQKMRHCSFDEVFLTCSLNIACRVLRPSGGSKKAAIDASL